ncbi:MAG: hypothetical protein HBSAPP02_07400 [Phycisphaerae bacterium]|nr:MAG: peptidylprolyl isomerase [Planctomycetia bacterium]RIK66275.1 MAG: hypothetical protein DCC66_13380 [Planctomycetota bacterium]GJQ25708.1 MAG: hypothetical protein HBSAPP02_07400 [Phycisphaerae bacterium]
MTCLFTLLATLGLTLAGQTLPTGTSTPEEDTPVPTALTPETILPNAIRAELRTPRVMVPVGSPVFVEFTIINISDAPVKLSVPGALVGRERYDSGIGLPLEHVFSAAQFRGLEVVSETNPAMGERVTRKPEYPIPAITLAPYATIGLRFDVARFYPGLHQAGIYQLTWRPYGGVVTSNTLQIHVVQYKQVVMETEFGNVTFQLLYDKAPHHVANFLDLVDRRFYNGKVFHLVFENQFLLGGCPNGDGTGRRPDGVTLPPEFNDTPFQFGTVGMALIEGDPQSGSSQFFICLSRQPNWDGRYTAFAQIAGPQSLAVLRKMAQVEVDAERRPKKPLLIKSMSIQDAVIVPRVTQ